MYVIGQNLYLRGRFLRSFNPCRLHRRRKTSSESRRTFCRSSVRRWTSLKVISELTSIIYIFYLMIGGEVYCCTIVTHRAMWPQ